MFRVTSKLDLPAVRTIAEEYRQTIKKLTPDIYTEIEGVAKGAVLDVADIVALNCRSEIALGLFLMAARLWGGVSEVEAVELLRRRIGIGWRE
jgi:isopenicillin-N N-acyltransferase-like protein